MPKEEEIKPVFLDDGEIAEWTRPLRIQRPDLFYMEGLRLDALTEIVSYDGFDKEDVRLVDMRVIASAARYKARIARLGKKVHLWNSDEKPSNTPEEMILFAGEIVFYKMGVVPGTNVRGFDFVRSGEIWTARKPHAQWQNRSPLWNLLFENNTAYTEPRINALIRGYEDQELDRNRSESRRRHEEYNRGAADRHESDFGTFGR